MRTNFGEFMITASQFKTLRTVKLDNGTLVDVVSVSARNLGFRGDTNFGDFSEAAKTTGLELCSDEAFRKLCKQAKPEDVLMTFVMSTGTTSEHIHLNHFEEFDATGCWATAFQYRNPSDRLPIDAMLHMLTRHK